MYILKWDKWPFKELGFVEDFKIYGLYWHKMPNFMLTGATTEFKIKSWPSNLGTNKHRNLQLFLLAFVEYKL